jgi:hypothetical protein
VAVYRELAFADKHEAKAGQIHSRAPYSPTSGSFDNLRSDRAGSQQGDHIGKRFHVSDDL